MLSAARYRCCARLPSVTGPSAFLWGPWHSPAFCCHISPLDSTRNRRPNRCWLHHRACGPSGTMRRRHLTWLTWPSSWRAPSVERPVRPASLSLVFSSLSTSPFLSVSHPPSSLALSPSSHPSTSLPLTPALPLVLSLAFFPPSFPSPSLPSSLSRARASPPPTPPTARVVARPPVHPSTSRRRRDRTPRARRDGACPAAARRPFL